MNGHGRFHPHAPFPSRQQVQLLRLTPGRLAPSRRARRTLERSALTPERGYLSSPLLHTSPTGLITTILTQTQPSKRWIGLALTLASVWKGWGLVGGRRPSVVGSGLSAPSLCCYVNTLGAFVEPRVEPRLHGYLDALLGKLAFARQNLCGEHSSRKTGCTENRLEEGAYSRTALS